MGVARDPSWGRRTARSLWWAEGRLADAGRALLARAEAAWWSPAGGAGGPLGTPAADRVLSFLDQRTLVQPDRTSCGSSSLVLARMLREPAYAAGVLGAADPQAVFGRAALDVRRRTNAPRDASGHLQLPWPGTLGVRPAAAVRMLRSSAGFGAAGTRYRTVVVDPRRAGVVFDEVADTVSGGEPVLLYVGDERWMRHIVLAVAAPEGRLEVYDPAVGSVVPVSREEVEQDRVRVAGWWRLWLAVVPG